MAGKGSDEDCSPECLLIPEPVKDPYSTDEEEEVFVEGYKEKKKSNKLIFPKNAISSEITGPETLFFFDLDYKPQGKPIDLNTATVEEILETIFKFIYDNNDGGFTQQVDHLHYKVNNKTMSEIYRNHLEAADYLAWMVENDCLDFKTCTSEQWLNQLHIFKQIDICDSSKANLVVNILDMLELIYTQYEENGCRNHEEMKDLFRMLDKVLPPTAKLKCNGKAKYNYFIHENVASDNSLIFESRVTTMNVKSDWAFMVRNQLFDVPVSKIVVEVYAPNCSGPNNTSQVPDRSNQPNTSKIEEFSARKSDHYDFSLDNKSHHNTRNKPQQKTNAILSKEYIKSAFEYLCNSVPRDCRSNDCISTMTGHHVVQLLSQAAERMVAKGSKSERAVGLFMKNEYLYFSKLSISFNKFLTYGYSFIDLDHVKKDIKGEVTYSNFCLDLTKASHRMALLVFLVEFLSYID